LNLNQKIISQSSHLPKSFPNQKPTIIKPAEPKVFRNLSEPSKQVITPTQPTEPKKTEIPTTKPQPQVTENRPVVQIKPKATVDRKETDDENVSSSKGIELMRSEALARINPTPKAKEADLTDSEILTTYIRMRDDQDPLSWMILGYDASVSPDKLIVLASGTEGFDEFVSNLLSEKPVYMYLKYRFGDTGRSRFIFMSFVPEAFNGLQKARVLGHRTAVESFIKYYQISWHCLSIEEITEQELNKKLRKAGGADYSAQEENKGNFSSYKKATRDFYEETDKKTAISSLSYTKGPLSVTPCDISGRSMVAPASEVSKNTSEIFKGSK